MEQQKLTNVKETLTFLSQRFPKCFVINGEVKPLKIGIFQDLVADLGEVEYVSKRLLRMSLRHYTSGWKYLASVKEGNQRVSLDGELGDKVEAEHAQHAAEQLAESKQKAAQKRQQQKEARPAKPSSKPSKSGANKVSNKAKANPKRTHVPKDRKSGKAAPAKLKVAPLEENALVEGLKVSVKLGQQPMAATVTEVGKDGVFVQLNSGMTVKVQQQQLRAIVD